MYEPLTIELLGHRNHAVLTLRGRLIDASTPVLRRALDQAIGMYSSLELNVEDVSSFDSFGMRELSLARRRIIERDGNVKVIGLTRLLRRQRSGVESRRSGGQSGPGSVMTTEQMLSRINQVLNGQSPAVEVEEHLAIAEVVQRLRQRFPSVETGVIERVVADCNREYDGRPIREFVPLLVERDAGERLRGDLRRGSVAGPRTGRKCVVPDQARPAEGTA